MVQFNTKDNEILVKIVYYGPGLSGKTTNLQKLHEYMDPSQKTDLFSVNTMEDRTLFFDLLPVDLGYIYGNSIKLQIYTVPGQVHYDSTRRIVLSGADGVIFIADSSKAKLHENVQSINNLYHNLQANRINIKEIPLVMQYNKRDLPDALPVDVLNQKLNFRNIPYFSSVATKGEGVIETFAEAVQQTVKTIFEKYQLSKSVKNLNSLIGKLNQSILEKAAAKQKAEKLDRSDKVVTPKVKLGGKTVLKYTHTIDDDDRGSQDQLLQKALTSNMETARLYTDLKNSQQALVKKNEELSVLYKQLERSNNDNNKMRRFLESLVNFAGDAIVSFNDLWVIQNWNQAAEELFGYRRSEILNQNINTLFPDEGMAELNRIITIVTNGKVVKGFETTLLNHKKKDIPVSITFSPIKNKNDTIIAFTAIIRDLSAMNKMQDHLFSIQKYESLGFLLPHFRKALTANEGQSEILSILNSFNESTSNKLEAFSINSFVEDIHQLMGPEIKKRNIKWVSQLNPHLPEINIRKGPFIQGFLNLLINAFESVTDTENPRITIGTHFLDGHVLFQIINNGRGIPPEAMNQIFSSNVDRETLTKNLRFKTARQLFSKMNTLMRIDSSPKKGTKITLKIPHR
ncbi:MAG: hypothetical protein CR997_07090 [Acidobacteria bacterium]|nr:MAG: hypothetical protein CR997_07090 [Acidobacteriota bacterium]